MNARLSDSELVRGITVREESCFEELLNRYSSKVFNLAMRITRNQEDSEEVMQDVFVTVFTKVQKFNHRSAFSSWLYRVTMNTAFMKLRARNRRRAVSIEEIDPAIRMNWVGDRTDMFDVTLMSSRHELRDAIEAAIARLPNDYRAIFIMRDVDGLSNEAVGAVLQLSVPAVKSRLHRSRVLLREALRAYHGKEKLSNVGELGGDEDKGAYVM